MSRAVAFLGAGYLALLVESALGVLLPGPRSLVATPELALFVVLYLGLSGRGGAIGLTASALALGYLRDLVAGTPRGVEALAFAVIALSARALHGRVFLDRYGQLAAVTASFALLHAILIALLGAGEISLVALLRLLPGLLLGALLVGPVALRVLRRIDRRFSTETRSIELDGRYLGGSWR